VQFGRLLRTAFLTDYFVNDAFRRELLRVLNRGEAVNALERTIYTVGWPPTKQSATTRCRRWLTP
jgi:TnpA family transposase